jgi:tRNA-dihydrouridine synthase 1
MEKKRKLSASASAGGSNGETTNGHIQNGNANGKPAENGNKKKQQQQTQTRHQPSKERVGLRYPYKGGDLVPEVPKELSLATPERIEASWEFFRKMGSPKYHVAPMVDQSELAYRMLCRKYGSTCAYTPMLHARLFTETEKYRLEHFTTCAEDKPLLTQFCANDPAVLLEAAKHVEGRSDAVDINFGCPQRIAKRGNYGAFLMDDMDLAHRLVSTLAKGLKIPVTCKIRVFPDRERTLKYAKLMQDSGCMLLAVHGRTREQKNCREIRADWGIIKEVKELLDIPVLANGNIRHFQDADECMAFTGCDGVLSAEPLLLNPALFSREKLMDSDGVPILPEQPAEMLLEYLDLCEKYPTPQRMIRAHVHKLMGSWFNVFPEVRQRMNNEVSTIDMYRKVAIEMRDNIRNHTKEMKEAETNAAN